jgi:hypothetical protein
MRNHVALMRTRGFRYDNTNSHVLAVRPLSTEAP